MKTDLALFTTVELAHRIDVGINGFSVIFLGELAE